MKRFLQMIAAGAAALVLLLGMAVFVKWYSYVTTDTNPHDELGIKLNAQMPAALRDWGCGRLKEKFSDEIPPYGCAVPVGNDWVWK